MATIIKGYLDGFRGLLGNAVGASYRELDVIRGRPKKSSKAPTQTQLAQRARFALATHFSAMMEYFYQIGYKSSAGKAQSPVNAATQQILRDAIVGAYPDFSIDYSKVILSKGKLYQPSNLLMTVDAEGNVNLVWEEETYQNALNKGTDRLMIVFFNESNGQNVTAGISGTRSALTFSLKMPRKFFGVPLVGWIFCVSEDEKAVSDSFYLGEITIPKV